MELFKKTVEVTVSLGKVAHYAKTKSNEVEVKFGFHYIDGNREADFAVSAGFWNTRHTDYDQCGQCLDEVAKYFPDHPLVKELVELHKKYHLKYFGKIPKKDRLRILALVKEWSIDSIYDVRSTVDDLIRNDKSGRYETFWIGRNQIKLCRKDENGCILQYPHKAYILTVTEA